MGTTDIQDLQDEVSEIRRDVAWLREQEQEEVDISDLAQDVYDELEPLPESGGSVGGDVSPEKQAALTVITPDDTEDERYPQTAQALAERLDTKAKRVEDAIAHLEDQFLPVVAVELNGERHYFKED